MRARTENNRRLANNKNPDLAQLFDPDKGRIVPLLIMIIKRVSQEKLPSIQRGDPNGRVKSVNKRGRKKGGRNSNRDSALSGKAKPKETSQEEPNVEYAQIVAAPTSDPPLEAPDVEMTVEAATTGPEDEVEALGTASGPLCYIDDAVGRMIRTDDTAGGKTGIGLRRRGKKG